METSSSRGQLLYGHEDPLVLYLQKKHISNKLLTESKILDVDILDDVRHWLNMFGFRGVMKCGKSMKVDNELITALVEHWRRKRTLFIYRLERRLSPKKMCKSYGA